MRLPVVPAALAAACTIASAAAGVAPASAQDFSITNTVAPANGGRRDILRQLQTWWDVHGYYPRRASENGESGTVNLRLLIRPDGNIWTVEVVGGSGSASLDDAAAAAFRGGFVRPLPDGAPDTGIDLSLHYVLSRRPGQPVAAGSTPVSATRPFTVTNDPVKSAVVDTMLQRNCTGTVVKQGIRNHPAYGVRYSAQAVFFRRPDGTPWVRFYEGGFAILAPVVEVGRIVKWSGRKEYLTQATSRFTEYTVWADNNDTLNGSIQIFYAAEAKAGQDINRGGTIDLSCTTETVPAVTWSAAAVTPIESPAGDPP